MNDSKIARFSRFDRALTRARAFRRSQFHAGDGVGTGKDFTLFALRDGEVMFKVGANKKKFVTVVDAVGAGVGVGAVAAGGLISGLIARNSPLNLSPSGHQ